MKRAFPSASSAIRGARWLAILAICFATAQARAVSLHFGSPAMDKWSYANAFNNQGGASQQAPVFAFLGTTEDDDRMGTMLLGFNTSPSITAGLGKSSYNITSVTLTVTVAVPNTFRLDSTHDTFNTYQAGGSDGDVGRPVEVFGVGLRNNYVGLSGSISGPSNRYNENSPYFTTGAPTPRNVFPLATTLSNGGALFDASDNITQQLEAYPFAVATAPVAEGAFVPDGVALTFNLQLNPTVLDYLQGGLNDGILGLMISSLYPATGQNGDQSYPILLTREGAAPIDAQYLPQLDITYTIISVPEPSPVLSVLLGLGIFTASRAFHRRRFFL